MIQVIRTVGTDRIVDEFVLKFTHTTAIDWMLPSTPAIERTVEVPIMAIVQFLGEKLVHEHIYWDQAPVPLPIGLREANGLPGSGAEQAREIVDKTLPGQPADAKCMTTIPTSRLGR